MPRPDLRWLYPLDWPQLSAAIRFGRAKGRCECCGRPHGHVVECAPDGRWLDGDTWRSAKGRPAKAPTGPTKTTRVRLSTALLDHDPSNSSPKNLKAMCQRCRMIYDRDENLRRRRITYKLRWALGDLFLGPYVI